LIAGRGRREKQRERGEGELVSLEKRTGKTERAEERKEKNRGQWQQEERDCRSRGREWVRVCLFFVPKQMTIIDFGFDCISI